MNKKLYLIYISLIIVFLLTHDSHALASEYQVDKDSIPMIESIPASEENPQKTNASYSSEKEPSVKVPPVKHPSIDTVVQFGKGNKIRLAAKIQNYTGGSNRDQDILSPKSVNIHPSGKKFYVNSLEGGKTVVYSLPKFEKLAIINHKFNSSHSHLWAPPSGLFNFRHYTDNLDNFTGKPVESAFSHNGRYLWVPYYRRSYDLNAQDPSALAVIDTSNDTIVRIMETGVLPKMVAVSPDGSTVAIAHWGDNTVGLIDASSNDPKQWKYKANVAVGRQLFHDFSLTEPVDRDKNTGEALRGSVFTPDSRYLLVGCMSGGGIAVIDVKNQKYLGKLFGMMANVRHLVMKGDWLYASINIAGYVQRIKISEILDAIAKLENSRNASTSKWQTVKVEPGARTLELSPAGDYIFVACNSASTICILDSSMQKAGEIYADSYPVGLDVSPDGKWLISTSQGRKRFGGNCIDIYELSGLKGIDNDNYSKTEELSRIDEDNSQGNTLLSNFQWFTSFISKYKVPVVILSAGLIILIIFLLRRHKH